MNDDWQQLCLMLPFLSFFTVMRVSFTVSSSHGYVVTAMDIYVVNPGSDLLRLLKPAMIAPVLQETSN